MAATAAVTLPRPRFRFDHAAAVAAAATGVLGLLYAVAFVVRRSATLSATCLLLGALASTLALVALHERAARESAPLARWALLVATLGALGAAAHGGYDLANALHPPAAADPALPSAVDPRGLLTFGLTGIGTLTFALLLRRDPSFPRALPALGALSGVLSIALYVGRLVVLDPASTLIAAPAVAEGFVVAPLWWLGVATALARADARAR